MKCRLCLTDAQDSISIFNNENIQKCITKFLQLELSPDDPVSNVMCLLCWRQLENFQEFYNRVDAAQKDLAVQLELRQNIVKNAISTVTTEAQGASVSSGCTLPLKRDVEMKLEDEADHGNEDSSSNEVNERDLDTPETDSVDPIIDAAKLEDKATTSESVDPLSNTRNRLRRCLRTLNTDSRTGPVIKRRTLKRSQGTTKCIDSQNLTEAKDASNIEINVAEHLQIQLKSDETAQQDGIKEDLALNQEPNTKRRRGRPRKGEERPKVEKVRSEKSERILETAKEFDEIIRNNMDLTCSLCGANLENFAELKRHFRAIHKRKGYAVCCNKRLYKRGLVVDHINTHNNPEYFKCSDCGKVMADRMCLRNHMLLMHQNEEDKVFKCAYCPKKFAKQYLLDHHQVKHIPQEECSFFCVECGRGFPTKTTLTKHLNQIHSTIYDKMCEICAKLVRGNAAFERHMEDHEGIVRPQVQCEVCGSWLKDKNSLRKHMYKHDGKSYTCNVCGKVAPSKSALQSHRRYVHQTDRSFKCSFCEKSFKKSVNLREHLTTHTGEILYTCPHCPKTFNSKANMHAHRKKKHREEWEANRRHTFKSIPTMSATSLLNQEEK